MHLGQAPCYGGQEFTRPARVPSLSCPRVNRRTPRLRQETARHDGREYRNSVCRSVGETKMDVGDRSHDRRLKSECAGSSQAIGYTYKRKSSGCHPEGKTKMDTPSENR